MAAESGKSIALIGAGSVGKALLRTFIGAGYTPTAIVSGSEASAEDVARISGCEVHGTHPSIIPPSTSHILVAVPDDALERVIADLSAVWVFSSGTAVFHTSGIRPADVLEPLRRKGATVFSIHPVRSFAGSVDTGVDGIFFGVEGDETGIGFEIVKELGGIPFLIEPGGKLLYHAACTFASGYLVTLLDSAARLMREVGVGNAEEVLVKMAEGALSDWKVVGAGALTGSVARGDAVSVGEHIEALDGHEQIRKTYTELTKLAVQIALDTGRIESDRAEKILKVLET